MTQRAGPRSGLLATQTPAPMVGNSSGSGRPIPAATRNAKASTIGQNSLRSGTVPFPPGVAVDVLSSSLSEMPPGGGRAESDKETRRQGDKETDCVVLLCGISNY